MDFRLRQKRRRTYNEPGDAHEITFSCYRGFEFSRAERTCLWLAESINSARKELDFPLWAFVLMPEHVHLIVYPRKPIHSIEDIRKAIKEPVARRAIQYLRQHAPHWLPRITRRRGKRTERLFWQSGGGFDRNIKEPKTLLAMIDYIHVNPVRRSLVTRARDRRWSSVRWFEGITDRPTPRHRPIYLCTKTQPTLLSHSFEGFRAPSIAQTDYGPENNRWIGE